MSFNAVVQCCPMPIIEAAYFCRSYLGGLARTQLVGNHLPIIVVIKKQNNLNQINNSACHDPYLLHNMHLEALGLACLINSVCVDCRKNKLTEILVDVYDA